MTERRIRSICKNRTKISEPEEEARNFAKRYFEDDDTDKDDIENICEKYVEEICSENYKLAILDSIIMDYFNTKEVDK